MGGTTSGYRRSVATNGLPAGPSANHGTYAGTLPNRSSFNGSSSLGSATAKQGTALVHAARNGVIGPSSSIRSNQSSKYNVIPYQCSFFGIQTSGPQALHPPGVLPHTLTIRTWQWLPVGRVVASQGVGSHMKSSPPD